MEAVQSQDTQGAFTLSFGDVHRRLNLAKKIYKLSGDEFLILQCFIQALNRPGYKTHLNDIIYYDIEYWEAETGMLATHIYRAFRSLHEKKVIVSLGSKGKNQCHYLHSELVWRLSSDKIVFHKPVDKSSKSDQVGHTTQTKLVTVTDQVGHTTQTKLVTVTDQVGHSASYIEDSLLFPEDSLTLPSSIPAVDNVDNFETQRTERTQVLLGCDPDDAKKFLARIKPAMEDRYSEFLDFSDRKGWKHLGGRDAGVLWAKFFYHELPGQLSPEDASALRSPN